MKVISESVKEHDEVQIHVCKNGDMQHMLLNKDGNMFLFCSNKMLFCICIKVRGCICGSVEYLRTWKLLTYKWNETICPMFGVFGVCYNRVPPSIQMFDFRKSLFSLRGTGI